MSRIPKTCTVFDGKAGGSIMIQGHAIASQTILTLSLLDKFCRKFEKNDQKGTRLFKAICANLTETNHLDVSAALDDCSDILRQFGDNFIVFLKKLRSDLLHLPPGESPELKLPLGTNFFISPVYYINRYKQLFDELEIIAEGGFGIVCKARHRVDGVIYAVKKIPFKYTNEPEFKMIIREAESFANLKHRNIVNYNNAWLDNFIGSDLQSLSSTPSNSGSTGYDERSVSGENGINKRSVSKSSRESFHSRDRVMFVDEAEQIITSVSNAAYIFSENLKRTAGSSTIATVTESSCTESNEVVSYSSSSNGYSLASAQTKRTTNVTDNFSITTKDSLTKRPRHLDAFFKSPDESSSSNSEAGVALNNNIVGETISHRHGSSATCSFDNSSSVADQHPPDLSDGPVNKCSDFSDSNALVQILPSLENVKWDLSGFDIKAVLYIQMEYCDTDLSTWLREKATDSNCDKLDPMHIFKQIVSGVKYIHSKSVIHRDLKPKNIFLFRKTGHVKIGDFGLATLPHHTNDSQGNDTSRNFTRGLGTLPYAAPEQRKNTKYDCKVDIYSLGIILFEILHPVSTMAELINLMDKISKGEFPSQFIETWPEHVHLIKRLLDIDPRKRPSATEILDLLRKKGKTESIEEIKSRILNLSKEEQIDYLLNCLIEKDNEITELYERLKIN